MTGTRWSEMEKKRYTNKQLGERLDNIESFDVKFTTTTA